MKEKSIKISQLKSIIYDIHKGTPLDDEKKAIVFAITQEIEMNKLKEKVGS